MSPVERILGRLEHVTRVGDGYSARCPAHDDGEPSLAIGVGDDGRALLYCHAGCPTEDVTRALGLATADLFVGGGGGWRSVPPNDDATLQTGVAGCTLAQYAEAKWLPLDFLRGLGLSDVHTGQPSVRIPYLDESGLEVAVRFRRALTGDRFKWKRGSKPILYGLDRLPDARAAEHVVVVEGESDCHALWYHGSPAVGLPSANTWNEGWAAHFDGIGVLYVVVEPDQGGDAVRRWVASSRIRDRVRFVHLGELKDPSALHIADPEGFKVKWQSALDSSVPWTHQACVDAEARMNEARKRCAQLANATRILPLFVAAVKGLGVVGERRALQLIYLAITSRLLRDPGKPVSVAVKGPSSAGKSYIVERTLALFPPSAFYPLSAMSEHALAYSEEPLKYRMLVIYEAAGLKSEFASYLVRSLLSEGRVRYETVEKTKEGLRPRLIEREGPTGLIVTTTALRLHPENETRLLSVTIADTPAQTEAILLALAGERTTGIDLTPWHALQEWLAAGECRVAIPYARLLARQIPPVAVRLRRDVGAVLNLVRAHALLHRATRERDAEGRIVATVGDYAAVRRLVSELVAQGVGATVPITVRETVAAVERRHGAGEEEVTISGVAKELALDHSTASRRVKAALAMGYVRDNETRKGKPARLVLGGSLPENRELLPPPRALMTVCTVAPPSGGIQSPPSGNGITVQDALTSFPGATVVKGA